MSRYFKVILLSIFLLAVMLIVVLQFNSDRSINQLISGNETLLQELEVRNDLLELQTAITSLESKVRGTVISGQPVDPSTIQHEIGGIHSSLDKLKVLEDDKLIQPLLKELNTLAEAKIRFNRDVLDAYNGQGKRSAEALINTRQGSRLSDSIRYTTSQIHEVHELTVKQLIRNADRNGERAKTLGKIMAVIAAIAAIFSFGYVSLKIRQQQQLISKLNISERKAKEAVHVKENFLANMSHEIRTPMNAILGFTDLLLQEKLEPRSREYVETIHKSGEGLLTIINDILDLSRIEAGMMRIERVPFHLDSVINTVERLFSSKAMAKQVRLVVERGSGLPEDVIGDSTRLMQILVNLLGNAFKFTNKGQVKLSLEGKPAGADIVEVTITVEDTGIGIEPSKLSSIFERFRQADDEVNRKFGGTGLGLSIVRDLVNMQDGTITVDSVPGKGTAFTVRIPYSISKEKADRSSEPEPVKYMEPLALNILVAEDNSINQNLVRQLFSQWKLKYDMADNGAEVLELLKQKHYDLVLMDIQMPGMDGYTTTRKIREELRSSIPVIAMTAHALAGERDNCLANGMNDYIAKPLRQNVLYEILRKYVRQRDHAAFELISLDYMKEVSGGDLEYEKLVTSQFLEAMPEEMSALEQAFVAGDIQQARQLAHNLKTTISVMGLNSLLDPLLDKLEYEDLQPNDLGQVLAQLKDHAVRATAEAHRLLGQLKALN